MGRLLGGLTTLLVYLCAATLLSEVVVAGYLWSAWKLDQAKLLRMMAVAQGAESAEDEAKEKEAETKKEPASEEQASFAEVLERRAVKTRDLELREQSLDKALDEVKFQQQIVDSDRQKEQELMTRFTAELKSLKEGAQASGRELVRRTLETVKPRQAKEQLFEMLQNNEMDQVVMILAGMQESRRAKILAEFKTPEENRKLAEVLRRLREGQPESSLVDRTDQPPTPPKPAGS